MHKGFLVGSTLAISTVSVLLWLVWLRKKKPKRHKIVNKVLFFPDQVAFHQLVASKTSDSSWAEPNLRGEKRRSSSTSQRSDEAQTGSMWELFKALQQARCSIDVCVFNIASSELCDILIAAHESGVIVRVVTNDEQMVHSGNQVNRLRRSGIQVRVDEMEYFMHHKFAIVDGELLMNGSLNWTTQGLCGNQENVILTSEPALVQPFLKQFELLWKRYDPVPQLSSDKAA